jgi:hypothetical protein
LSFLKMTFASYQVDYSIEKVCVVLEETSKTSKNLPIINRYLFERRKLMKNIKYLNLIMLLIGALPLPACRNPPTSDDPDGAEPTATAVVQATVDADVAMTATAQAANDAAIEQAVQATAGAAAITDPGADG